MGRPDKPRESIIGPHSGPEPPFPLKLSGKVIKGFGRGSKELGIPTANIPIEGLSVGGNEHLDSGIYFGWAGLDFHSSGADENGGDEAWDGEGRVHPMVMSVGWNPYYKNEVRSVEVHIMHDFTRDFYDAHMNLVMLGFIRPEYDYESKETLIEDIKTDIKVAGDSLARPAWAEYRKDSYLLDFPKMHTQDAGEGGGAS